MADGKIIIETDIDQSGAEKGVSKLKTKLSSLGSVFLSLGATAVKGMAVVTGALSTAGAGCVNIASNLIEVQNVVDTTFGSSANQINEWAKNARSSFGLSELQAKQFTGTLGAMLKSSDITGDSLNTMSTDLVGLSADFSSFYNLGHEEAFEKITSAMNGETEAIRSLGINMNVSNLQAYALSKGINKSWNEMSQAEQTTLRYNYLMEKGADASGDFAKTLDTSLANQLRVAKNEITSLCGEIGQNLLPSVLNGAKVIREEIGNISEAFKNNGFNGLAEQLGNSIGTLLTKISEQLPNIVNMGINIIQSLINGIEQNLPMIMSSGMQIVSNLLNAILQMLPQLLEMGMQMIIQLATGIGQQAPTLIPLMVDCIVNMVNTLINNLPLIIDAGMQLLDGLVTGILNALPKLIENIPKIIETIVTTLTSKLPDIIEKGGEILLKLIDGIINNLPKLIDAVPKIITSIITTIGNNLPKIIETGILIVAKLVAGLIKSIPTLVTAVPKLCSAINKGFTDVDWSKIGINIVKGIWNGITSMGSWLAGKVSGFAGGIVDSFKKKLGIHSPSVVAEKEIGKYIPPGIGNGVKAAMPKLTKDTMTSLKGYYTKLQNAVNNNSLGTGIRSIGSNFVNNVINNPAPNINNVIQNHIDLDGREVAKGIAPYQNEFDNYALGR